jgi:cytosine/adenosine deaminase-related metal-dependent hydrolase
MKLLIEARNATLGVEDGRIVDAAGSFDAVIRVPDGELRPGLINAHDHLHRNHYGRLGAPPYANAYDWGRDIQVRHCEQIATARAVPRRHALEIGAWKNLFAGVTTVVHHDRWEPAFDDQFPLNVVRVRCAHSLGFERDPDAWRSMSGSFAVHLAEGIDRASADEVRELDELGLLTADLMAIHVVGADADGVRRLRQARCAVVWCPTSNLFLFGATSPPALLAPGIDLMIGSDSLVSGAGTLLDELRAARALSLVADERLIDAVADTAARRLGLARRTLEAGASADLVVLRRDLLDASAADVALVVAAGVPRVVDPVLAPALGKVYAHGRRLALDGVVRWVLPSQRAALPYPLPRLATNDARPDNSRMARL